jgi:hypothetical protein
MEDGQVTVLVLLDFSQAFDMVIHWLLLCKLKDLQTYSDGAQMLVDSCLNGRTQFMRCGENSLPLTCGVCRGKSLVQFYLFLILMMFRGFLSTAGSIFMRMISKFITVLVFWIYKGFMMRSKWICSKYMSELMD